MEENKSLVRTSDVKLPKFVEQAYDSIEGMKQFANMLLDSKLVPDSYYEKGVDNKPDYTKGKTSAVVIVLLQAQQLAVPPMTGLQHIVPVNGLLSIKGDLAKTMIFASGKLKKDSWKETVTGSIEAGDMVVSITATREDNGITLTRSFSVEKAKRMGLWVTEQMANGTDGWKHKKSAWYKTPDRMLFYRCLGNLARDLFSDVLLNMYTTEEAVDIDRDVTEIIETESGAKITIPDKEHSKGRSAKMTDRVADKIPENKFGVVDVEPVKYEVMQPTVINESNYVGRPSEAMNPAHAEKIAEIAEKESPFIAQKGSISYMDGKIISDTTVDVKPPMEEQPGHNTMAGLEGKDQKELLAIVNEDMDMMEASEIIGGKNTKRKLAEIIMAHQEKRLDLLVLPYLEAEKKAEAARMKAAEVNTAPEPPVNTQAGEIPVNKAFESQGTPEQIDAFLDAPVKKPEEKIPVADNKYSIEIPEATPREFSIVKGLFNRMMGVSPQITTPRFLELSQKLGYDKIYADKELFIKTASVQEINTLLNSN